MEHGARRISGKLYKFEQTSVGNVLISNTKYSPMQSPQIISFTTPEKFEKWLSENYELDEGIWLKMYKKDSGEKTVVYKEALDVALCYGWIDGQVKKYDDKSYIQKFTPRRKRSNWSKRNVEHIERLTAEGRMKPSGIAEVERAKADGRWEKAYDSPSEMEVPEDFLNALKANPNALEFFQSLNKINRFAIAYQLHDAKRPETREKRFEKFLNMMMEGKKPY
jgi:uncharacterized protein YdeI (YjbR/CyaY-like superfamily)